MSTPSQDDLCKALRAAGSAHHDYQTNFLNGKNDEQWPGWYAAYVLGRLGDFVTPTVLTQWLLAAPMAEDWSLSASEFVTQRLSA